MGGLEVEAATSLFFSNEAKFLTTATGPEAAAVSGIELSKNILGDGLCRRSDEPIDADRLDEVEVEAGKGFLDCKNFYLAMRALTELARITQLGSGDLPYGELRDVGGGIHVESPN